MLGKYKPVAWFLLRAVLFPPRPKLQCGADRLIPFSIWIKQRHFYGRQKHFSSPPPARSRLTFWPRFYISRNYLRNRVEVKDGGLYSTYLCTEFRCGSCSDSHFSWRCYICKFRLEVLETPKTTHFVHFSELTCSKIPGMPFLAEKKRLRQAYRPHQAYNISEMYILVI